MPTFAYKALGANGESTAGSVVAATRKDALNELLAGGRHVVDIREDKGQGESWSHRLHLPRRVLRLSDFSRQMATLFASGVPLVKSLNVLIEQAADARARSLLAEIRESVKAGSTLADAMGAHPRTFPKVMVGMVRVGEIGGTLDEILLQLSELFDKEEALRSEVRSAMAYPSIVLFLGLASAVALIAFLIPRLAELFSGMGADLPTPTRVLMWLSEQVTAHGLAMALLLVVALAAGRFALRRPAVAVGLDRLKLRLPWIGNVIRQSSIARFSRLLGTLAHSGVSVVGGLDIVEEAIGNRVIAGTVHDMARQIRQGRPMATLMKESGVFPPLSVQMVAVGEETGRLDQMLLRVAETYERETAAATRTITSLLAPAMLLGVAAIVGFIILSMMLPIFQLSSVVR